MLGSGAEFIFHCIFKFWKCIKLIWIKYGRMFMTAAFIPTCLSLILRNGDPNKRLLLLQVGLHVFRNSSLSIHWSYELPLPRSPLHLEPCTKCAYWNGPQLIDDWCQNSWAFPRSELVRGKDTFLALPPIFTRPSSRCVCACLRLLGCLQHKEDNPGEGNCFAPRKVVRSDVEESLNTEDFLIFEYKENYIKRKF